MEELKQLQKDLQLTKNRAYAEGTQKNLHVQWNSFMEFCRHFQLCHLPASVNTLCLYAQYLSYRMSSVESIRNYLHGVKLLHLFAGLDFPHLDNFVVKLVLRGLKKTLSHTPRRALPITPDILLSFLSKLNLSTPVDATYWCAFVFAFFSMARKSNICPPSVKRFSPSIHLCRGDIVCNKSGLLVMFKWSKTIQNKERLQITPLVTIPDSPLCPLKAYQNMIQLVPGHDSYPAFMLYDTRSKPRPITHNSFVKMLRVLLAKTGHDPSRYTGHSFRRGGATWAIKSGVQDSQVKAHGDCKSDAYLRYIDQDISDKVAVAVKMTQKLSG